MNKGLRVCGWWVIGCLMASLGSTAAQSTGDFERERILERYRTLLVEKAVPSEESVRELVDSLGEDGRWPDLDYGDQSRGNWHPYRHLARVRELARGWAGPGRALQRDSSVLDAARRALDDWIEHRYEAVNWWFNEIGAPRMARDIVVLLDDGLGRERRSGLLEIIGQHRVRGTGANLVWTAELSLHYGCLTGDGEQVEEAVKRIREEITVGAPAGIQEDWSFYQHGARLQTFHYGRAYLDVVAAVAWQLRETEWALPADEIRIVSSFILEGMQWMVRGRDTVPGTMDRMASRPGTLRVDLVPVLRIWRDVDPERRGEIEEFIARQQGNAPPLVGFRHFPRSDFTAYHRPGFSFFLKTVSERTHLTESINKENLLGGDLNAGDHYLVTDVSGYHRMPPVWDWDRLPGVTRGSGRLEVERTSFVGGVGDGRSGLAAMGLRRRGEPGGIAVRRSWAFHGDRVLALWGGWEIDGDEAPYTAIDQRLLRGDVVAGFEDGRPRVLEEAEHDLKGVRYLWHDGIGYLLLEPAQIRVRLGEASGSWHRINSNRSDKPITEPIFLAVVEHGESPVAGGFVTGPVPRPLEVRERLDGGALSVLRNDVQAQVAALGDNVWMAALFEPGMIPIPGSGQLVVNQPCLVLQSEGGLRLADPTHRGGPVAIGWNGRTHAMVLPPNGETIRAD